MVVPHDDDKGGMPVRAVAVERDSTERHHVAEAKARLAAIVTSSADAIISKTLDGVLTSWNEAAERMFGYSADEMIGQSIRRLIPADRQAEEDMILARLARSESIQHFETVRPAKNGRTFDAAITISPVRDFEDRIIGAAKIVRDISERKRSERALQASKDRLQHALDAAQLGSWRYDPRRRTAFGDKRFKEIFDVASDEMPVEDFKKLVHPEDAERFWADCADCQASLGPANPRQSPHEYRVQRRDGEFRWVEVHWLAYFDGDAGDRETVNVVGVVQDITERKQSCEREHLLMREITHRARNLLNLVQVMARQTAAPGSEDFVERFAERIQALSANQNVLIRNEWHGVEIEDLVDAHLALFADLIGSRIDLHGPKLRLSTTAAQTIGLAVHELATNAGKYGALSTDTGGVEGADADTFTMRWIEREGPLVSAPQHRGFGTVVMEAMAERTLDGKVELLYPPSGVTWRLICPAANALEPLRA
jgi:PAS domain S-box-containing protein